MLRVLVAEDSATARMLISSLLASDPDITVVGRARNGEEAVALCAQLRPDVVTMDIQMPVMDGLEATRRIVAASGTPVIMVSSLDPADVARSMQAFNAGALAVLAKPSGPGTPRFEKDCQDLIATVRALAEPKSTDSPLLSVQQTPQQEPQEPPAQIAPRASARIELVGIVASTGGPIALRGFFASLPANFRPPIIVVQHIAAGFTAAFAGWLAGATSHQVRVAADQEPIREQVVYIAPDDSHISIARGAIAVTTEAPTDGARPSGTLLLASLAKEYGPRAAGVLLSGSGPDGIEGLRQLHEAGGAVFVEDETTCTMFETPRGALERGVVKEATPLAEIPRRLAMLAAHEAEVSR